MISRRAACCPALQRGIQSKPEAIWITDEILSRALHRFYLFHRSSKRDVSSVPGPMESRKRTGKRRIANLSEAAKVSGQDFGALWGVGRDFERQQWQWEAPSKRQPLRAPYDKPCLPTWLSEYRPALDFPTPVFRPESSELAGSAENLEAIENQLHVFEESLRTSSTDHLEALCESYNHWFGRNLVLGLVSEPIIHKSLEVVTKTIQQVTTDKPLGAARCLYFYTTVWNGVKASKVLRPIDLGSGLLNKFLVLLGKLPCSPAVQSLAIDIIRTSSHDQLDGMRKGISHITRAWLSSWDALEINGSQAVMDELIVYEINDTSPVTQSLLNSVRTLAKFLDELPRFLIQRTVLKTTNYLVSNRFASFKWTFRKLKLLRYAWVSVIANMPCVNEKLLIEVWTRMDTFHSAKNGHDYVPSIPRLSLHESCNLLLDFWISKGQIKAPKSVTAMFAVSVEKSGQSDSVVHLIQAIDQCDEAWGQKAGFLFRFLRNIGKPEAVYYALQKLVAKELSPPIYVFAREVQEMSLINPRCALNIYKLRNRARNSRAQPLVDLCPNLVLAMIKSPSFDAAEIWATLNITRIDQLALNKSVNPARVRLVQEMAVAFARAEFRSPRIALRNVVRCMLYLRRNGVPASKQLSRALTEAGITRSVLNGRWVGREKALWILDVIEQAEGLEVRTRVEQIWEDSLMKGIVHQQRLKREANPLRRVGTVQWFIPTKTLHHPDPNVPPEVASLIPLTPVTLSAQSSPSDTPPSHSLYHFPGFLLNRSDVVMATPDATIDSVVTTNTAGAAATTTAAVLGNGASPIQASETQSSPLSGHSPTGSTSTAASASASASGVKPAPISSNVSAVPTRIRRRNRMITSCLECRRRKLKCDKSHPCVNCNRARRECVFLSAALDQASQLKLTEIKEKVGSLERLLERDVARSAAATASLAPLTDRALPDDADDDLPGAEDERDLEPTPLAVGDAVYEDDGDNADNDLLDLGIQIGKMRITERIGGFFRPKISEELEYTLSDEPGTDERLGFSPAVKRLPSLHSPSFLKPGSGYIAPASGFFFGQPIHQTSLIDFLPSRLAADRLIKQYFMAVHRIAQCLHRPTFEKEYESFWEELSLGIEPPPSVQAVVFAAMFSGLVSLDEPTIWRDFGVSKVSLIDNFKLGTEASLVRANFLRTTKVETLQAFIMYLIPLCREEVSRAHSVLVGAAIRMAECMGLHRDGESYGLNPLETHVRRLIWYQLCFLDIRTCEAQGPRPTIHRDDFDTKLPLNVDDVDLHPSGRSPCAVDRWTDATFTLIRFEANEMMRTIWVDRPRIERRKISLTAVLSKIETFRRNMAAKYDHLIDDRIPLHRCAKMTKSLLLSRLHIMTLHRYHNSVTHTMPERLRQIMLTSGTVLLESSVALEIMPELQLWKWYTGAYHQYHVAFLMLIEVFFYPDRKECDRIWPCLDYVFETDRSETRDMKARKILRELQEKTAVYQEMRKMRAPASMNKALGQRAPRKVESTNESTTQSPILQGTFGVNSTSIGRAPLPEMVFAGISNGETLWALPNQASPENSSDTSSVMGQLNSAPSGGNSVDDLMVDIDWEAFDQIFPPEQMASEITAQTFDFVGSGLY